MGKDTDVSRAVVEDGTALLLAAVDSIKKAALGRLRGNGGSDAARILDQEMSNRLLHLACRHDAVECARLLLDGEYGITPACVDARDQLTRTPLHVAADAHSKRCIQLLLSAPRNARTDARLLDGTRLVALEVALMSRSVQVDWSPDNSVEDLLAYLQQKDLNAVELLAEKTREVGEVAYRCAMEGRVAALAMLLLVAEDRISAMVSVVIDGVRTKRSIYNSVVDEVLSMGEASARDGNEMRRKPLLCEIQLLNQFGATSWRDQSIDRRSLPPLLRAAQAGDMSVTKVLLMRDVDAHETDPEGNIALHWCLSSSSSTQETRIVWLLLKNGARVFQEHKLDLTPVHNAAAKGNYMALQSLLLHAQNCVHTPSKTKETPLFLAVKNGSLSCVRLLLRYGANPKAQNLRKQRPTDVATSQDMRFLLNSANVVPMNHGSTEKNHAMKKERHKELLDDDFDDYDKNDYYGSFVVRKASLGHRDFRSSNLSAQEAKSRNYSVLKEGPKLSQHNDHWEKHDYTCKIFVGGLPLSVDDVYLSRFFSTEFGPVEEAMVITLKIDDKCTMEGSVAALAILLLLAEDRILAMVSVMIDGVRTKRSIYSSVVDEVQSIGEASARDINEIRKALLREIQLLNQFGASSWRNRSIDRRSLPPLLRAAKAGDVIATNMLLMGDVDVNEINPEGNTALRCCLSSSSSTQEPRIVWLLLKNGARVFQGNKLGLTPVHSTAARSNYKTLQTSSEESGGMNKIGKDKDVPHTVEDDTGLLLSGVGTSRKLASSFSYTKMAIVFLLMLLLSISQVKASCGNEAAWKIAVKCLDSPPSNTCCQTIMTSINGSVMCLCHISTTSAMTEAGLMITELLNTSLECGALPSSTVLPHDCLLPAPPAGAMEGLPSSPPAAASLEPPPSPPPTVELPPSTPPASLEVPPPSPPATVELPPPTSPASLEVPPPPPPAGTAMPPPPPATMVESPAVVVPVVLPSPAVGVIASDDTKGDHLYKWTAFGLCLLLLFVVLALVIMIGGPCTSRLRVSSPCFSCSLERISPSSAVPVLPGDVEQSDLELAAAAARQAEAERSDAELAEAVGRQANRARASDPAEED